MPRQRGPRKRWGERQADRLLPLLGVYVVVALVAWLLGRCTGLIG